ncbi:unnamed protein product, partial [Rotaria sp. Silwood2]
MYAKLPFDVHQHCLLVAYPVIITDSIVHTGLEMDSYFTIWTNQNDNHSCIDQAPVLNNLIEQNPRKDLPNKE